jgi:Na+-driven multidrug efflux pump
MGVCLNINAWAYMLPLGLASAVNTSISNALGAGEGAATTHALLAAARSW